MTDPHQPKWAWEQTDERRSGSSGDIAKLFKNEGVKQPGPFAKDAPSVGSTASMSSTWRSSTNTRPTGRTA